MKSGLQSQLKLDKSFEFIQVPLLKQGLELQGASISHTFPVKFSVQPQLKSLMSFEFVQVPLFWHGPGELQGDEISQNSPVNAVVSGVTRQLHV